jgi:hypothetical protein
LLISINFDKKLDLDFNYSLTFDWTNILSNDYKNNLNLLKIYNFLKFLLLIYNENKIYYHSFYWNKDLKIHEQPFHLHLLNYFFLSILLMEFYFVKL